MLNERADTPDDTSDPRSSVALKGCTLAPMVSYSQNFEDVMIRRALQDIDRGFYVDIGAFDATKDSVTRWFYDSGWRGINVEPNPKLHSRLLHDRPEDKNLWCAISSISPEVQFNIIEGTGLSTLSNDLAAAAEAAGYSVTDRICVPTATLDQLLEVYAKDRTIDFLKIDAEGSEAEIIGPALFIHWRPRVVVVEATKPFTFDPTWEDWEPVLLSRKFRFAWFDGLNRFYVREEDSWRLRFFQIPPCVRDNFTPYYYGDAIRTQVELEQKAEELKRELAQLSQNLAEVQAALSDSLEEKESVNRLLAERDLSGRLRESVLIQENETLARLVAERGRQLAANESAMLALSISLDARRLEAQGTQAELLAQRQRIRDVEKASQAVKESMSWRVTAPLRFAYDVLLGRSRSSGR